MEPFALRISRHFHSDVVLQSTLFRLGLLVQTNQGVQNSTEHSELASLGQAGLLSILSCDLYQGGAEMWSPIA